MSVKEAPTTYCDYYKTMKSRVSQQREEVEKKIDVLLTEVRTLHKQVSDNLPNMKFNPRRYEEFVRNKYIDGLFLRGAKTAVLNRKENYTLVSELYDVYNLAKKQKELYDAEQELYKIDKMLALKRNDYRDLIKAFYSEVHRQMILNGYGYAFEGSLGWICINRVHITDRKKTTLDFVASKKRKAEIIAEGKKVWNKEEADYCARHGIEYDAVDHRVYKKSDEYHYEIPLISCRIEGASDLVFKPTDYRDKPLRGKTNQQLIEENDSDINKIVNLPCDIKTKITLCVEADKTLYLNFIRNENQKSVAIRQASRKNRQ